MMAIIGEGFIFLQTFLTSKKFETCGFSFHRQNEECQLVALKNFQNNLNIYIYILNKLLA